MSTLFDLSAKIALITGSASGLGKAMAQGLAQHGARVVLNGRSGERLDAARREFAALDLEVHTACFDIYDQDAVAAGLERIAREVGDIDILVNNVGFRDRRDVDDFAVGDIDTMLSKNLGAPFERCPETGPIFAEDQRDDVDGRQGVQLARLGVRLLGREPRPARRRTSRRLAPRGRSSRRRVLN